MVLTEHSQQAKLFWKQQLYFLVANKEYIMQRSAHMVFVRINYISCLTEKTEYKLQKTCWQGEPQHRKMVTYKGYKK